MKIIYRAFYIKDGQGDLAMLRGLSGNTIILITDGRQECLYPSRPECLTITSVKGDLIARKIRVITIALGDEADPEIEDLALSTGGKSYYVEDGSGAGDINDAFTGSTTYQPGDTLANSTATVYQRDWSAAELVENGARGLVDYFDIDPSLGREVVFQIDLRTQLQLDRSVVCQHNITVALVAPDDSHTRTNLTFRCDTDNFGVFRHALEGLAAVGRWVYVVRTAEDYAALSVLVSSKGRSQDPSEPIMTRCWVSPGNGLLAVMGEVKKGQRPVIGARVTALVERPGEGGSTPPLHLQLLDNGAGQLSSDKRPRYSRGAGGYFCRFCVTIIAAMVRSFLSSSSCQHFLLNDLKHYFSRRGCH